MLHEITAYIFFFFSLDQLLLWDSSAGLHMSGSLPVHRTRHPAVPTKQAPLSSYQLPVGLDPVPGPHHP